MIQLCAPKVTGQLTQRGSSALLIKTTQRSCSLLSCDTTHFIVILWESVFPTSLSLPRARTGTCHLCLRGSSLGTWQRDRTRKMAELVEVTALQCGGSPWSESLPRRRQHQPVASREQQRPPSPAPSASAPGLLPSLTLHRIWPLSKGVEIAPCLTKMFPQT